MKSNHHTPLQTFNNNTLTTIPSNVRRWFEEEAIDHNESCDGFVEDNTDLYNYCLAAEILDDNSTSSSPKSYLIIKDTHQLDTESAIGNNVTYVTFIVLLYILKGISTEL